MKFHRTRTAEGRWATTPRLASDIENDDAVLSAEQCDHAWPDELLPETMCDRCGLRYCDWTETP